MKGKVYLRGYQANIMEMEDSGCCRIFMKNIVALNRYELLIIIIRISFKTGELEEPNSFVYRNCSQIIFYSL